MTRLTSRMVTMTVNRTWWILAEVAAPLTTNLLSSNRQRPQPNNHQATDNGPDQAAHQATDKGSNRADHQATAKASTKQTDKSINKQVAHVRYGCRLSCYIIQERIVEVGKPAHPFVLPDGPKLALAMIATVQTLRHSRGSEQATAMSTTCRRIRTTSCRSYLGRYFARVWCTRYRDRRRAFPTVHLLFRSWR
jgi:hypothetical protein